MMITNGNTTTKYHTHKSNLLVVVISIVLRNINSNANNANGNGKCERTGRAGVVCGLHFHFNALRCKHRLNINAAPVFISSGCSRFKLFVEMQVADGQAHVGLAGETE